VTAGSRAAVTPPWLLNDENSAPSLPQRLSDLYAGSAHVRDVGLTTADDEQIRLHARDGGYLIVTKDDDFRQRSFLRGAPPKVLWAKLAIAPPPMLNEHCAVGMQRLLPSRKMRWLRFSSSCGREVRARVAEHALNMGRSAALRRFAPSAE